jgi:hypothetical protein
MSQANRQTFRQGSRQTQRDTKTDSRKSRKPATSASKPLTVSKNKTYNAKLAEEYKPPFTLNYKWNPQEKLKMKLPNPYVQGQFETFMFPVCASETKFADRALFYKEYLDIQEQAELEPDNVPYLYHMFKRCLKDQSLVDWNNITEARPRDARTIDTYSMDIDTFIKYHESRDNEDLLHAQISYMSKLHKPMKASPSEFRNQLLHLNNLILAIPEATTEDQFSPLKLKYLFVEAMPANWRKEFRKVGKKTRSEELDELAHFFDVHHDLDPPASSDSKGGGPKLKSHSRSSDGSQKSFRIKPTDICPLHGNHCWNDCFDNKNGPNFRPPSNNRNNIRHDNHYQDEVPTPDPADDPESESESEPESEYDSDSDNPYDDDFNTEHHPSDPKDPELVPMTFMEGKQNNKTFHLSKVLADSGGTRSSIARTSIPKDCEIHRKERPFSAVTSAGTMDHFEFVKFDKVTLPEFCRSRWLQNVEFVVFDDNGHSAYDAILGRDVLDRAGIDVKFSSKEIVWDENSIPFHPRLHPVLPSVPGDPPTVKEAMADCYMSSSEIRPSDYDTKTTGQDIANQQEHLSPTTSHCTCSHVGKA